MDLCSTVLFSKWSTHPTERFRFHRTARFERICGYAAPAPQSKWKTLAAVLKDPKRRSRLAYNLYEEFDARYFPQENDRWRV